MNVHAIQAPVSSVTCDLLAIGVPEGGATAALASLDQAIGGGLIDAASADEFKGKAGSIKVYPTFGRVPAKRIAIVGLGDESPDALRRGAGLAASAARSQGDKSLVLAFGDRDATHQTAMVEGAGVGNYRFDRYKPEDERKAPLDSLGIAGTLDQAAVDLGLAIVAGQNLARDLVAEQPAEIYPETLAQAAVELAGDGVSVEVWDEQKIKSAGMGGITAVGQASSKPPRFVHMTWSPPGGGERAVAIVGKGVTFDAGGLSIKTSAGMQTMRCDMAGAAAVIGTMAALKRTRPDIKVHGIFGAVENMLSAESYKLGDILTISNGKTVEVHNTDAEGRLVLADCLAYASKLGVDTIVDMATLTGACMVALGEYYTGLFTNDNDLRDELLSTAEVAGEGMWQLPMPDHYKEKLKADWGAIKNVGGAWAGATTAALFLSEFVSGSRWAHLDIAGPAFMEKTWRHYAPGGTGAMVPTMVRWIGGL